MPLFPGVCPNILGLRDGEPKPAPRSAARPGVRDVGVNRARSETLRTRLATRSWASSL